mgnify:CR=1 FL=1
MTRLTMNWCAFFTFDSSKDDGIRSRYDRHDVKILSVQEDGTVDFLVYGYMNRGKYEGHMGVIYYSYDAEKDTVNEKFYLAASESFEKIREDISTLSYLSQNSMMYLMLEGSVYGIDLKSNEFLVVAQGLTKGSFAVSGMEAGLHGRTGPVFMSRRRSTSWISTRPRNRR